MLPDLALAMCSGQQANLVQAPEPCYSSVFTLLDLALLTGLTQAHSGECPGSTYTVLILPGSGSRGPGV